MVFNIIVIFLGGFFCKVFLVKWVFLIKIYVICNLGELKYFLWRVSFVGWVGYFICMEDNCILNVIFYGEVFSGWWFCES